VIDPSALAANLERGADGLWWPKTRSRVDYPDEGNAFCFQVEDHSFWFHHRNACILAVMARFPPGGAVFDIGGGNGFVARALVQAGLPSVVVEPGPAGARNAQARGLDPVICSTLDDAGFGNGALPAAGLFDVLEHIDDHRGVLQRLATLIAPGGRLYLTVPAYQWLWSNEDAISGHHRRYTRRSLSTLVQAAGFAVEFSSYLFWPLPLPILLFRALPARLGRRPTVDLDAIRRELKPPSGPAIRAMTAVLNLERRWLERGGRVPTGGSCLLVARRPATVDSPVRE
jgi:SAM-dependent methyltransferase